MTALRFKRHAQVFIPFASLEVLTQLVTAAAGLLVVRLLPVAEFAVYAIAVAAQGSLAVSRTSGFPACCRRVPGGSPEVRGGLQDSSTLRVRFACGCSSWWLRLPQHFCGGHWLPPGRASVPAVTLGFVLAIVAVQVSATVDGTMTLARVRPALWQSGLLCGSLLRLAGGLVLLARARLSWVGPARSQSWELLVRSRASSYWHKVESSLSWGHASPDTATLESFVVGDEEPHDGSDRLGE